jgi:hypothetical protein
MKQMRKLAANATRDWIALLAAKEKPKASYEAQEFPLIGAFLN